MDKISDNILNVFELEGKKYKAVDISDYIRFQEEDINKMIKLPKEKRIEIFNKKVSDFQAFKAYIEKTDEEWHIDINGENILSAILFPGKECIVIGELSVHPGYRGAGIGEKAMRYIELFVKELGYKCMVLVVQANIRPLKFWRKVGFIPINKVDKEYIVPLLEKLNDKNILIKEDDSDHMIEMIENI